MFKTDPTVRTLKTIAVVAGLATMFWSLGLPLLQFAGAAALTNVSNTLSDSDVDALSDHEIRFTTLNGVGTGETITVTFPPEFTIGSVDHTDIMLVIGSSATQTIAASAAAGIWGAEFSGQVLTITSQDTTVASSSPVTIFIGENATSGALQIANPDSEGSYVISITSGTQDTGSTNVVILESVLVTATVETIFTFAVSGVGPNESVNGTTTTGSSTANTIPFGILRPGVASTAAQDLVVGTNAQNGYTVTVQLDGAFQSGIGSVIYGFNNGSDTDVPVGWIQPTGTVDQPLTYGHWGVTSDDADAGRDDEFTSNFFIAASTTPRIVMGHDGPANEQSVGIGTTRVGYQVEISPLLPAASDYETRLIYVATPRF